MAEVGEEDEKESSKGSAAHNQTPTSTHTHITSSLKLKFSANHLRLRLQWYSASNLPFSTAIDMAMFDWDFCFNFIEIGNTRFSLPYREPYHIYSFDFSSFFLKKKIQFIISFPFLMFFLSKIWAGQGWNHENQNMYAPA
jgi:hypothetical protein